MKVCFLNAWRCWRCVQLDNWSTLHCHIYTLCCMLQNHSLNGENVEKGKQHWHHVHVTEGALWCDIRALYRSTAVTESTWGQEMGEEVQLHGRLSPWRHRNKSACGGRDLAGLKEVSFFDLFSFFLLDLPASNPPPWRGKGLPCVTCTECPPLAEWSRWRQSCHSNSQHSGQK